MIAGACPGCRDYSILTLLQGLPLSPQVTRDSINSLKRDVAHLKYLIFLLVFAMLVAPVFWMMPSPRQKRAMRLRERAMQLGMQVSICDLPQSRRSRVRKEQPEQGVAYRLAWQQAMPTGKYSYLCLRVEDGFETIGDSNPLINESLQGCLSEAPPEVLALECNGSGLLLFWREHGSVDEVEKLHAFLQTSREAMLAAGLEQQLLEVTQGSAVND